MTGGGLLSNHTRRLHDNHDRASLGLMCFCVLMTTTYDTTQTLAPHFEKVDILVVWLPIRHKI
jgi:hypothetical protein